MARQVSEFFLRCLELRLGSHTEAQLTIGDDPGDPNKTNWAPGGYDVTLQIGPTDPDIVNVLVHISFWSEVLPGVWEAIAKAGVWEYHIARVSSDLINDGVPTWLEITRQEPLEFRLINKTSEQQFFGCTLWYLRTDTQRLPKIREIARELRIAPPPETGGERTPRWKPSPP